jgi:hypothetical protein
MQPLFGHQYQELKVSVTAARVAELRPGVDVQHCFACEKVIAGRKIRYLDVYQPFDDTPERWPYCVTCDDDDASIDDVEQDATYCGECGRWVRDSNGHRVNVKEWPGKDGDFACVACLHGFYLEHGHTDEEIEGDTIPCDFYDRRKLLEQGWREGEQFDAWTLERTNGEPWRAYCRLIKLAGGIVLTEQGPTPIIFGPDWVTVWFKDLNRPVDALLC